MTEGGDEHSRPLKLLKGIQKKKSDQNNENANYECGSTCFKDRSSSVIHFLHFYIFTFFSVYENYIKIKLSVTDTF